SPASTDHFPLRPSQPARSLPLKRLVKPGSTSSAAKEERVGMKAVVLNTSAVKMRIGVFISELMQDFRRPPRQSHSSLGIYFKVLLRNLSPFVAISFRVGSILRQIAAARAMTFTSVVNDSITTSPL